MILVRDNKRYKLGHTLRSAESIVAHATHVVVEIYALGVYRIAAEGIREEDDTVTGSQKGNLPKIMFSMTNSI